MALNNPSQSGYSDVNGIKMYYEIYGKGKPLVLIHGGGSTIETSFGRIIPLLATNRKIIAMELQAHGRTSDRDADESFVQDAEDVVQLLKNLKVGKADFLGFSNGGQTLFEICLRHPGIVNKAIFCSAFYKRPGVFPHFWEGFHDQADFDQMPQQLKDGFLKVNNNAAALMNMFKKDVKRMQLFTGWSDEQMKQIIASSLVINSDADVATPEHAVEMFRIIPNCQLAILPGVHGAYLGEITTLKNNDTDNKFITPLIEEFLN